MTKKSNIFFLYFLILIEILILLNSNIVINAVRSSIKIFLISVFPSLFPTMVIGIMLVKNNVYEIIPKFIKNIFKKVFNYNDYMTSIFIISLITGTPSNALYINEYLDKGLITNNEAESLLLSTHFINPLFVIGMVGNVIFKSTKIGFIILLTLWISNLIKAYITRPRVYKNINRKNISCDKSIINSFFVSIKQAIYALLTIMGIIILFNMLTILIREILHLNNTFSVIINGILEMTGGVTKVSELNINTLLKIIMTYIMLNFGGLSIHMQAFSMLENKKIRYLKYLIFRLF